MNLTFDDYIRELGLESLPEEERLDTLREVAKTVHTQFLVDIEKLVGEENFDAIATSAKLGPALYVTTLKHLVPNYNEVFESAKQKIFTALQEED
jgi:hypothetical protein